LEDHEQLFLCSDCDCSSGSAIYFNEVLRQPDLSLCCYGVSCSLHPHRVHNYFCCEYHTSRNMNNVFHNFAHVLSSILDSPTTDVDSISDDHSYPPSMSSPPDNSKFPDWKIIPSFGKIWAIVSIFEYFTEGEEKSCPKNTKLFFNELEEPDLGVLHLVAGASNKRDCLKKDLPSYSEVKIHLFISSFMLTLTESQQATFSTIVSILPTNGIEI
jgi:hypothetical protein